MSVRELEEWRIFNERHPIGDWRQDYFLSLIAATIANYAGRSLPKGKTLGPEDFNPFIKTKEREKRYLTSEELLTLLLPKIKK